MYYLGCDNGGSKTAVLLSDEHGTILSAALLRMSSYEGSGFPAFGRIFRDSVLEVTKKVGIRPEEIDFSYLGLTGFDEGEDRNQGYLQEVTKLLPAERIQCVNDIVVGWAGSLACRSGINLISGTGTNSYGRDDHGNSARAGGWGYFCGDEGSAYWLGRQLLSIYTKQADNRLERGKVYEVVREAFHVTSDIAFRYGKCEEICNDRTAVASLQRLLLEAARGGDPYAVALYVKAADELAMMVGAIVRALNFDPGEPIRVSYSGGTFQAGAYLLSPLAERIQPLGAKLVKPRMSPVFGAVLAAITMAGGASEPDEAVVAHLAEQEACGVLRTF